MCMASSDHIIPDAYVLSAFIRDMDQATAPYALLVKEKTENAKSYRNKVWPNSVNGVESVC
jgi:hypothetical protein